MKEFVPGNVKRAAIRLSAEDRARQDEVLGDIDHVLTRDGKPRTAAEREQDLRRANPARR